jgi:hypothetical protein
MIKENQTMLNIGQVKDKLFSLDKEILKKHFVALGASGSGKTVICKTIIEEAAMLGIPAIIIDPQGDISSLSIMNESSSENIKELFKERVNVTIFTPASSKGIPICINPLQLPKHKLENEEMIGILNQISTALCDLLGYDLLKDEGKSIQALFFLVLDYFYKNNISMQHFDDFSLFIQNLPDELKKSTQSFVNKEKDTDKLVKRLKFLTIGEKELMFSFGVPLDVSLLLGKHKNNINDTKTQISIIYLNTLESQKDKEFFVSMLSTKIYEWMLSNPSKFLQALFYIDEISTFLPAGALKPSSKPILTLLYKQARKYGIGCIMSTQNPGDIDYKAFAQFGTWAVGRLTTIQDRDKIKDAITAISKNKDTENITKQLPLLKPGNFIFFCPDIANDSFIMSVRRLYTKHLTLTEKEIKEITTNEKIKQYEPFFVKKQKEHKNAIITEDKEHINTEIDKNITKIIKVISNKNESLLLKQNISEKEAKEIISKTLKYTLFGLKRTETIHEINLTYEPLILTNIKKYEKNILSKKISSYNLFFSFSDLSMVDIKNNTKYSKLKELIALDENCIKAIKKITSSQEITKSKLSVYLNFDKKTMEKVLLKLHDLKLIATQEKKGETVIVQLFDLVLPKNISDSAQESIDLVDVKDVQNALNTILPKIEIKDDLEKLSHFLNIWYLNCEIIDYKIVFCPIYRIEILSSNGKIRNLFLNTNTGKFGVYK